MMATEMRIELEIKKRKQMQMPSDLKEVNIFNETITIFPIAACAAAF